MKSTWKKACTAWLLVLCLCAWLLPVQAEEIQGTNLPLDILQTDTGGEAGATARLEFSLKDTFRESYLEYCLAVSKQGEKDILTYDNHDKNDTVELTLQRGLCYSLYVLISDGQGSRAFSGVLRPMEDGTLMIGGEEILYEPEEEKPRTRSAGLMPVVYESEPNSNYSNADIIRPDECMKGYLATFYDTDCFKIEASNLSDARGYTVQLAVPPGVDYDIRIYDQSNNWVAEGIGSGDEYASFTAIPNRNYYISVSAFRGYNPSYPYKLCVSETDPYSAMGWSYMFTDSSRYNYISSAYMALRNDGEYHTGMDITDGVPGGINGVPIYSPTYGRVVYKTYDAASAGHYLLVETNNKDPYTGKKLRVGFMHMKDASALSVGDYVDTGDLIGYVGNTGGKSTGPHLHILMIDDSHTWGRKSSDNTINPQRFFEPRVTFRGKTSSVP